MRGLGFRVEGCEFKDTLRCRVSGWGSASGGLWVQGRLRGEGFGLGVGAEFYSFLCTEHTKSACMRSSGTLSSPCLGHRI